jgi:hypothetical protein
MYPTKNKNKVFEHKCSNCGKTQLLGVINNPTTVKIVGQLRKE